MGPGSATSATPRGRRAVPASWRGRPGALGAGITWRSEQRAAGELVADLDPLLLGRPPGEITDVHIAVWLTRGDREGEDRLVGVGELSTHGEAVVGLNIGTSPVRDGITG